jgi:hypothetical protein
MVASRRNETQSGFDHEADGQMVFETSDSVKVVNSFDALGLKEDLLRGIYAYSKAYSWFIILIYIYLNIVVYIYSCVYTYVNIYLC